MSDIINPSISQFQAPKDARTTLRYCVRVHDRGKPIQVIVVHVSVPRLVTPNQIKRLLERKVFDYIKMRWPSQLGMSAQILGRIDMDL